MGSSVREWEELGQRRRNMKSASVGVAGAGDAKKFGQRRKPLSLSLSLDTRDGQVASAVWVSVCLRGWMRREFCGEGVLGHSRRDPAVHERWGCSRRANFGLHAQHGIGVVCGCGHLVSYIRRVEDGELGSRVG